VPPAPEFKGFSGIGLASCRRRAQQLRKKYPGENGCRDYYYKRSLEFPEQERYRHGNRILNGKGDDQSDNEHNEDCVGHIPPSIILKERTGWRFGKTKRVLLPCLPVEASAPGS
jgi:hypothetical protein